MTVLTESSLTNSFKISLDASSVIEKKIFSYYKSVGT